MKKVITILFITFLVTPFVSAQRIVFESNFENISIHPTDSIPTGWFKLDVDNNYPAYPACKGIALLFKRPEK